MGERIRHVMRVPNSTVHLAAVREIVGEMVCRSSYPTKKDVSIITLAVDEAVANIMEHAYRDDVEGKMEIELEISADGEQFVVVLRDRGTPFDPASVAAPDIKEHVSEGRKHGLGLALMRSVMDEVSYTFVEGGANELRMVRFARLDGARGGGAD